MLRAHVSLACKTRAHKQDMETSGSDSELERDSGLDQASGSTSAIPTTNSDTSTASSFSLLANSFSSNQERAMEDYIQLSVMLQYNQR